MINDNQKTIDLKISPEAFKLLEIIVTQKIKKAPIEGDSDGKATARRFEKYFEYSLALEELATYMPCAVMGGEVLVNGKKRRGYHINLEKTKEVLELGYVAPFTQKFLAVASMLVRNNISTLRKKGISKQFRDMKDKFYFCELFKEIKIFTGDSSIISIDNPNKKMWTPNYVFDLDKLSRVYQSLYAAIYNRPNVKK